MLDVPLRGTMRAYAKSENPLNCMRDPRAKLNGVTTLAKDCYVAGRKFLHGNEDKRASLPKPVGIFLQRAQVALLRSGRQSSRGLLSEGPRVIYDRLWLCERA